MRAQDSRPRLRKSEAILDPRGRLYFLSSLMKGAPQGDSMRLISLKKQADRVARISPRFDAGGLFFRLPPESGGQSVAEVSNMAWRIVSLFCHSGCWAYFKEFGVYGHE